MKRLKNNFRFKNLFKTTFPWERDTMVRWCSKWNHYLLQIVPKNGDFGFKILFPLLIWGSENQADMDPPLCKVLSTPWDNKGSFWAKLFTLPKIVENAGSLPKCIERQILTKRIALGFENQIAQFSGKTLVTIFKHSKFEFLWAKYLTYGKFRDIFI